MLFDSYVFIFAFLPICLIIYHLLTSYHLFKIAINWLVICSLFFYGWWNAKYLLLMILSILVNYFIGCLLIDWNKDKRLKSIALCVGVTFNIGLIVFYKYTAFIIDNLNHLGMSFQVPTIILPLAISFFTFQQIAYLIDASRETVKKYRFMDYCLFVTFFPQLIAGPIVQHKQIMPQFENFSNLKVSNKSISIGFTLFLLGLIKKIGLADSVAVYANCVFDASVRGVVLSFWEAWLGAIAYTLQLYFDFSGYSDMALGVGIMFGITLPANFNSPYKAKNIIDFWRRWHITLSTFLRDYLYIALGGNKKGHIRRYLNVLITMLIGGLWHGANWTFVVWGGMHGMLIIINHCWRWLTSKFSILFWAKSKKCNVFYHILTLMAVITAWVLFRADDIESAKSILHTMYSFDNFSLPHRLIEQFEIFKIWNIKGAGMFYNGLTDWYNGILFIALLIIIALKAPNTLEIMRRFHKVDNLTIAKVKGNIVSMVWYPTMKWSSIMALMMLIAIMLLSEPSEFLYFQF